MDLIQTTLDGESVKVISIVGSNKNTSIFYIDSNNNLNVKVEPVSWEDYTFNNKKLSANSTFVAGTGSAPNPIVSAGIVTQNTIPLSWNSVPDAIDYSVYYKINGSNDWITYVTNISSTSQTIADLNTNTAYNWMITARMQKYTSANGTSTTLSSPSATRTIQYTSTYPAVYTNGLFQDKEPIESGLSGIPIISGVGRTFISNIGNLSPPARNVGRKIYGVRFLLGNMSNQPISGGKMIVGLSNGWNGFWTPRISGVTQNVITGNLMTGWQRVTIGGNSALPIPAAEERESGMPLKCVWTDWLTISGGWALNQSNWDFLTRFLVPPRSAAPYALTHGEWDVSVSYSRIGTLAGRSQARIRSWAYGGIQAFAEYHLRAEGDYVTDPTILANITTIAGQCPPSGPTFVDNLYGPPGIGHTPLLAIEYAIDPTGVN